MKIILSLISLFLFGLNTGTAQENWLTDFDKAKTAASAQNRPIMLVFQGSDWCAPCMKMEKAIWASETFQTYANQNLVLLKADFPRRKKNRLSKEQKEHNNQLAATYNQQGFLPLVVLLDKEGKVLSSTGYEKQTPDDFINSFLGPFSKPSQQAFQKTVLLMGSRFDLTVLAKDEVEGTKFMELAIEEIKRIEQLISSWDANSETSAINKNAGIEAVKVSEELFQLIGRSVKISELTDGAFDISFAAIDNIWRFDGSMQELPDEAAIKQSIANIDYRNIVLNNTDKTVFLKNKGMKIGFGAIGKGYAADKAKALLIKEGAKAGIINASGDMNTWGEQANGEAWQIGITNPLNKNKVFATLPIKEGAVVTSGDYEKFITIAGKKYSHIIDPRTGYPASGIISATVFAAQSEIADALATSLFVMGIETGINMINQIPNIDCVLIDDQGKIHTSTSIKIKTNE